MSILSSAAPAGYSPLALRYGPYSASKLLVARCPARFQGKHILKDQVVSDTINAARGNAIHTCFQKITQARVAGQPLTPLMTQEWIMESVGKYPAAYSQIDLVRKAVAAYVGNPCPYTTFQEGGGEVHCEVEIGLQRWEEESFLDDVVPNRAYIQVPAGYQNNTPTGSAHFTGKLDILAVDHHLRTVTVVDHKSTPNASQNSEHVFQLGCYAFMASLLYPGYQVRTVVHFAHPDLNFYQKPVYWEMDELQDMEEEIFTRIRAIESFQDYPALPGSACDYCHMTQLCPAFRKLEEQNAKGAVDLNVRGVEDLKRIAQFMRVTGVLYDRLNEVLKDGVEKNCPENGIAIDGIWYGFKLGEAKVDWKLTEKKASETLEGGLPGLLSKHGVPAEKFKEWDNKKLEAIFRSGRDELLRDLNPHLVYNKSTRWGGYKS